MNKKVVVVVVVIALLLIFSYSVGGEAVRDFFGGLFGEEEVVGDSVGASAEVAVNVLPSEIEDLG